MTLLIKARQNRLIALAAKPDFGRSKDSAAQKPASRPSLFSTRNLNWSFGVQMRQA